MVPVNVQSLVYHEPKTSRGASTTEERFGTLPWRNGLVRVKTGYTKRRITRPRRTNDTTYETCDEEDHWHTLQKTRELDPIVLESPKNKGILLEIKSDSKTVVDWITGKARQRSTGLQLGTSKDGWENGRAGPLI